MINKYMKNILDKCEEGTTSISKYITAKTPLILKCIKGHERSIIPSNLISRDNGIRCRECAGEPSTGKKTHASFLKEIQILYPALEVCSEYTSAKDLVEVKCTAGHMWKAIPTNLLSRSSDAICSICVPRGDAFKLKIPEINARIQVHYPYISVVNYIDSSMHATILDSRCGKGSVAYTGNLMRGFPFRCPHCEAHLVGTSAMEQNLLRFIKTKYSGWIIEQDKLILAPKHLDIVLPDIGLAIEFDGMYYHSASRKCSSTYHLDKTNNVEDFGYRLLHIQDSEWVNKRDIVESRICSILGISTKLGARKTKLKKIGFPKEFLDTNHIQGAGAISSVNYGLFLEEKLVAVMTFSRPKFVSASSYDYELVRFCSILGTTVVGGASKLLAQFRKEFPNKSIMSYADRRWSTGGLYKSLGFSFKGNTVPNYVYFKGITDIVNRYACFKNKLKLRFPGIYDNSLTQEEIMNKAGYTRVYDCGSSIWELK